MMRDAATGVSLLLWLGCAVLAHTLVALFAVLCRWLQVGLPLQLFNCGRSLCYRLSQQAGRQQALLADARCLAALGPFLRSSGPHLQFLPSVLRC